MSRYPLCFNINTGMKMIGSQFTKTPGEEHGNVDGGSEIILLECGLGPHNSTKAEQA